MNIIKSAFGNVEPYGELEAAIEASDCVAGHSFGTTQGPGSIQDRLARFIGENARGRDTLADRHLALSCIELGVQVDYIVGGESSNAVGGGVGTRGVLHELQQFMEDRGHKTALMVAQSHHVGRVVKQAARLGIRSVIPPGLPDQFDADSAQYWTRSRVNWVPREIIGWYGLLQFKDLWPQNKPE